MSFQTLRLEEVEPLLNDMCLFSADIAFHTTQYLGRVIDTVSRELFRQGRGDRDEPLVFEP